MVRCLPQELQAQELSPTFQCQVIPLTYATTTTNDCIGRHNSRLFTISSLRRKLSPVHLALHLLLNTPVPNHLGGLVVRCLPQELRAQELSPTFLCQVIPLTYNTTTTTANDCIGRHNSRLFTISSLRRKLSPVHLALHLLLNTPVPNHLCGLVVRCLPHELRAQGLSPTFPTSSHTTDL